MTKQNSQMYQERKELSKPDAAGLAFVARMHERAHRWAATYLGESGPEHDRCEALCKAYGGEANELEAIAAGVASGVLR